MNQKLLDFLKKITPEEQSILDGRSAVDMHIYNADGTAVIDSGKLLPAGQLIDIRVNTRFVHFLQVNSLFIPGAILAPIIAASIGKVPLPQNGSTKILSLCHGVSRINAAARVSEIGALPTSCL